MPNTRDIMGDQACLDALISDTITTFEDSDVTKVGNYALSYKTSLTSVILPNCTYVGGSGFYGSNNIETVDILRLQSVGGSAFTNASKLKNLIFRSNTAISGYTNSIFSGTLIDKGFGAIFVHDDLLSQYKSNTNWNKFVILPLSKYPVSDYTTIDDDWDTIISNAESGEAANNYSIGDTKLLNLGSEGTVYAEIVAFNSDTIANSNGELAGITFVIRNSPVTKHKMNPINNAGAQGTGSNGGWEYSEMRDYLANTILPLIQNNVSSSIKEVVKYSDYIVPGETNITHDQITHDKLWIPSAREVYGGTNYEQTGPIYTHMSGNSLIRIRYSSDIIAAKYFLRSSANTTSFRNIGTSGSNSYEVSGNSNSVIFGFCI